MGTPGSVVALIIRNGEVCRVTRRWKPGNYSLVGGSINPGEDPYDAIVRETMEEVGVKILEAHYVFERVDETDGKIAWCYHVTKWEGEPHQCEDGIQVSWGKPETLLTEDCTFREYNRRLFKVMGL